MSRDLFLLVPEFREAVEQVLSKCYELGVEMRPYFTVRTPWEQARLWRQSRPIEEIMEAINKLERSGASFLAHILRTVGPQNGPHVTNALPGLSWHQWAEAVDCYWHLEGQAEWSPRKKIELADGRKINGYRLYGEIARAQGLTSGGFWSQLVDWPHIQKRPNSVLTYYSWPEIDAEMRNRYGENETEAGPESGQGFEFGLAAAADDTFVRVKDDKFYVGGKEFKFVGFNVRALVHYGAQYTHGPGYKNDSMLYSNDEVQKVQLEMAYGFGGRVIRVFLAHKNATPEDIITRLEKLLGLIREELGYRDLYLLPALTNYYGDVEFYVRGDKGELGGQNYYQGNLAPEWFNIGYRDQYLAYVEKIVRHFRNDPGIFAWEVGNELKVETDPRLLVTFMHHMARVIRNQDPNHLVTTGMISTSHTAMHWQNDHDLRKQLYAAPRDPANGDHRPIFDFPTIHYAAENGNWRDADLAQEEDIRMPFIIEEDLVLKEHCHDRAECFKRCLEEWLGNGDNFGRGSGGYMVWGFDGANVPDGHPGGIGGRTAPPDWGPLRSLFSTYAEELTRRLERFGSRL